MVELFTSSFILLGLLILFRYGKEIYQHVQHWSVIAKKDAWDIYSGHVKQFPRCSTPGHHACLDKFKPDGNLIFKEPIL